MLLLTTTTGLGSTPTLGAVASTLRPSLGRLSLGKPFLLRGFLKSLSGEPPLGDPRMVAILVPQGAIAQRKMAIRPLLLEKEGKPFREDRLDHPDVGKISYAGVCATPRIELKNQL